MERVRGKGRGARLTEVNVVELRSLRDSRVLVQDVKDLLLGLRDRVAVQQLDRDGVLRVRLNHTLHRLGREGEREREGGEGREGGGGGRGGREGGRGRKGGREGRRNKLDTTINMSFLSSFLPHNLRKALNTACLA